MLRFYRSMMSKHPLLTQCVTSGCLTALGDTISQVLISRKEKFDKKECLRYFCVGSCFIAPVLRTWYIFLNRIVPPGTKYLAMRKMALDQFMFAPPFLASILSLLRLLDGNEPKAVIESVKKDYAKLLIANWQIWPFIQLSNFYFVPLNYQVILVNSASVAWNSYVAYVAEQKSEPGKEQQSAQ